MNTTEIKIVNKNASDKYIVVDATSGLSTTSGGIFATSGTITPTAIVKVMDIGGSALLEVHPTFDPVTGGTLVKSSDPCSRNTSFSSDSDHETTNTTFGAYTVNESETNKFLTVFPNSDLNGFDLQVVVAISDFLSTGYNIILKLTDNDKKIINFLIKNYKKLCQKY